MMNGMNLINPQVTDIDRQIQEERSRVAELERRKLQLLYTQPTILNQTIQAGPQQQGIRFAESIDDVKREMIFSDTLFVNKEFTNMWYKSPTGQIKTYLLEEFIPKDEKDLEIEALKKELENVKKEKNYESSRTNNSGAVESSVSETISTTGTNEEN